MFNMFKRKCKITFIKHGSTIYSEETRLNDKIDYPPLNELGKIEAENIAQWVEKRSPKVDKIYSSTNLKAVQSCKYVANEYKKEFEIVDSLYSKRAGRWSGLTFEQIKKLYPQELKQYHENRAEFCPENGESNSEFVQRVHSKIEELIEHNIGKRIIIVTNGDVIQAEICSALNIPPENMGKIYIPCGSATQLCYYSDWTSLVYSGYIPL